MSCSSWRFAAPIALGACALGACAEADPLGAAAQANGTEASAWTAQKEASYYVVLGGISPARVFVGAEALGPAEQTKRARQRIAEIQAEQAAIEPALTERGATVIARLTRLTNAIQVVADAESAARIAEIPGVLRVEEVPLAERTLTSAVPLVGAPALWAGSSMIQGDGIRVGIIDSGLDYTHADFGGPGTPDAYTTNDPDVVEDGTFPTARVVGGWDFVGEAYNPSAGVNTPKPDPDPLDCTTVLGEDISGGHGTHVAGIVGGNGVLADGTAFNGPYEASFDPLMFRVGPGVAPKASLYSFRVFGCQGSTTMLGAALDRAADPNNDGDMSDRMDVVNGSLGASYGLGTDTQGELVSDLTALGTLVVAAAGNDGQSFFVVASPAVYPEVLSVAASADNPLVTLHVIAPDAAKADYPAAEAVFTARLSNVGPQTGDLVMASPAEGCGPFANAGAVAGKIALIDRGTCPFVDKLSNAEAAGALAAIVADNEAATLPFEMGGAAPGSVGIAGVMIRLNDGDTLKTQLGSGPVTVTIDPEAYTGPGAETLMFFSARGPSGSDNRMKPEIAAPGFNIASAAVGTGTEAVPNSGTSMASPMVAGAAALVRQANPSYGPMEVKAALMNGSVTLKNLSDLPYGTSIVGAGRMDVERAATSALTASVDGEPGEVGVSFGAIVADTATKAERTFTVTNHANTSITVDLGTAPTHTLGGVTVTVSPTQLTLSAGASQTGTLTLGFDPVLFGDPGPDPGTPALQGMQNPSPRHFLNEVSGVVTMKPGGGGSPIVLPYHGTVRAAGARLSGEPKGCSVDPLVIPIEGTSAHPSPIVFAFALGAADDVNPKSATDAVTAMTDLRAIGVATDLGSKPFEEAQVYFGIAVEGDWSTPARGPLSVVWISVNSDMAGGADFALRAEARNPTRPFRDSLVTRVYDLKTGEALSRHPINIVTPDVAHTYPFQSSVIVLSAGLAELGIDPNNPILQWTASTERPDLLALSDKATGTLDAAHPGVDTALFGEDGTPMFTGMSDVEVKIGPEIAPGTPLDVLLLHPMNVAGKRWEIRTITTPTPSNVGIAAVGPAELEDTATGDIVWTVTNTGTATAPNVGVKATLKGGELVALTPGQGTCDTTTLTCALGDLPAGTSATITATVRPTEKEAELSVTAVLTSDLGCETDQEDNTAEAKATIKTTSENPNPTEEVLPAGGCACETRPVSAPFHGAWLGAAAALTLAGMRRRRRIRGEA